MASLFILSVVSVLLGAGIIIPIETGCPLTEVYSHYNVCDKYCDESLNNETTCIKTTGCKCITGRKRDNNGECVLQLSSKCRCPLENEVPNFPIFPVCEKYCNSNLHNCTHPRPRCICAYGYWRDEDEKCVKPKDCEPNNTTTETPTTTTASTTTTTELSTPIP